MTSIEFKNFSYRFPTQEIFQLKDFSTHIEGKKWVWLSGVSGSGKSTFLRTLNGLIPYFYGGEVRGELWVEGRNPSQVRPSGMSDLVQFVFQNPEHQLLFDTVEEELLFSLESSSLSSLQARTWVEKILEQFSLSPLRLRSLQSLSAGEKQMVALASIIILQPSILLLDEPMSQLDERNQRLVHSFIRKLYQDRELTIFWSDHSKKYFQEKDSQLQFPGKQKNPFWEEIKINKSEKEKTTSFLKRSCSCPVLSFSKVDFSFENEILFKSFSFESYEGEGILVVGSNGSGKTTLLKLILGICKPKKGQILRKPFSIGYVPQNLDALFFHETLWEELCFGCRLKKIPLQNIEKISETLNLQSLLHQNPRDFSMGEQQRAALGVVLVTQPKLLLLDEPSRGLDESEISTICSCLIKEKERGVTVILATHQPEWFSSIMDQTLNLSKMLKK